MNIIKKTLQILIWSNLRVKWEKFLKGRRVDENVLIAGTDS